MHVRAVGAIAIVGLLCAACSAVAGPNAPAGTDQVALPTTTATAPGSTEPGSTTPGSTSAGPARQWPATGALFGGPPDDLGDHYCSGAVVDTPGGDVVVTAAHCVAAGDGTAPRTGMSFIPDYHDHTAPFGVFTVETAAVDPQWQADGDPAHDVAFLTVSGGDTDAPIETVTGGYQLVADPGADNKVDAIGYPDFADAPEVRSGVTTQPSPNQLQLDAHGLYDGTSGGPWLRNGNQVVGVTGGYEQGGDNPDVSYASYFDDSVQELLNGVVK